MALLTTYELKALEFLSDGGRYNASTVGFALFENGRKANPSPQGMALAAGRFLGPLARRGFVSSYGGWHITQAGREALV